ncbi:MAG TPA: hypothetical protein VF830_04940 [Gemmatimonadales bacterium]
MPELEASRTLVKSTPELWAECSDSASLSRHLSAFGEIRITKLEPETAVAWEGDDVRGTVTLEPSGWGTRVVLTASAEAAQAAAAPGPEPKSDPEPELTPEPEPEPEAQAELEPATAAAVEPAVEPETREPPAPVRRGLFARLFGFGRRSPSEATPLGEEDPLIELAGAGAKAEPAVSPPPASPPTASPDTDAAPDPDPAVADAETGEDPPGPPELEVLVGALDSLGAAHKRPFSRS